MIKEYLRSTAPLVATSATECHKAVQACLSPGDQDPYTQRTSACAKDDDMNPVLSGDCEQKSTPKLPKLPKLPHDH